ncbi:MAG: hypothetical protein IJH34_08005 [Romboutsia sp.]|nr:hypothetical protein [Romboutsia sp.]
MNYLIILVLILILFIAFCGIGLFLFYKFLLPYLKVDKEKEKKESLLLFKTLYNQDLYSVWNEHTQSFLILKTIFEDNEIEFVTLFDNTQSVYSLFDRTTNPWKPHYKLIKISRNKLIAEKVNDLKVDAININGRFFITMDRFALMERNFYKSIIEERISSNGITIGEDIYNAIEGDYFYIELK